MHERERQMRDTERTPQTMYATLFRTMCGFVNVSQIISRNKYCETGPVLPAVLPLKCSDIQFLPYKELGILLL